MTCLRCANPRLWSLAQRGLLPRVFAIWRYVDVSGASGRGIVAVGCLFPGGRVAVEWLGEPCWFNTNDSLAALDIHLHDGNAELVWLDDATGLGGIR